MALEPITREEKFMAMAAGESVGKLTPITRQEMFLKQIADSAGGGGGGGTGGEGGGLAVYEEVYSYNSAMGAFEGKTITGEKAQKLADASEIYVRILTYGAADVASKIKVFFRFSQMYTHKLELPIEADNASSKHWLIKLEKMTDQIYIAEESLYNSSLEQIADVRKYILDPNMPSGELPSFSFDVVAQDNEYESLSLPDGGSVTIYARTGKAIDFLPTWEGGAY